MMPQSNCILCKGNNPKKFCGRDFCPIIAKNEAMFKIQDKVGKEDFQGSSPTIFVGRVGYPEVNVGILSPPQRDDSAWKLDAPIYWSEKNMPIQDIVGFRSSLINSRFKANVRLRNRFLDISKEISQASKPVDLEINLKEKPSIKLNIPPGITPMGPNATLKKVLLTSNPHIHTKVDKVVSDTDRLSVDSLDYLYTNGFDENFLSKLLSMGNLGIDKNRKIVPTRWSITAVDDTLGKNIIEEIKDYKETDYLAYFGGYLGNYYLILCFPDIWSYELFETYLPQASWNQSDEYNYSTDHEEYDGRREYAANTAGGYYANRLPILEKLKKMQRQGTILSLRFITGEYAVPLGVWVCREATRKSLISRPLEFESKELMIEYAKKIVMRKFNYNLDNILKNSKLLKRINTQYKLTRFIK